MPRGRSNVAATKAPEPPKAAESEQVELDDVEEEEEIEYEEVEEEIEEVVEEEVEEEVEEDPDEEESADDDDDEAAPDGDVQMNDEEEDERKKHGELLAFPPHGTEVYLGGIPTDASEEDLRSFCESVGEVTDVRLMKGKDSSVSRSSYYAFVTFSTPELAEEAIDVLNAKELKGKRIRCSESKGKNKLFVGNVPRSWSEEDLRKVVEKVGPGVTSIQLMKDLQSTSKKNRGFGFIEYYNHACAEYSRKNMSTPRFKLDENTPTVSWADTKSGDSSSAQVKAVYVKNLPKNVTEDDLKKLFEHHGYISKVSLPAPKAGQEGRYGFVHFRLRSSAMKALEDTERYELDGRVLQCSLAKPQAEKKVEPGPNAQKGPLLPTYPLGYGMMGGAYGALPAAFPQPMVYGRGAAPGMAMVPMILPDGRLGYVLQQPGAPVPTPPRNSGRGGSSSGGGRQGYNNSGGRRFRPY